MKTVLNEPKLIQEYNTEYYKLINLYSNVKRQSSFIKYYNLVEDLSPKNSLTKEKFDHYQKTKNVWDVYDLTPTQIVAAIQNSPDNMIDLNGQMVLSASSITIYTISNPRIGDLVTFYKPSESEEVFRVMNVRLQLNSNYSTVPLKWYELDLESAPIKYGQLDDLIKNNHYIYDLSIEKNIEYNFYQKYVQSMDKLKKILSFFKDYYLAEKDLYLINDEIPRELNEIIYYLKQNYNNNYLRLFEDIYCPYGYWDLIPFKYVGLPEIEESVKYKVFNNVEYDNYNREREIMLAGQIESPEMEEFLMKTAELMECISDIGEYIEHSNRHKSN